MLVKHYLAQGDHEAALAVAADYAGRFGGNSVLALLHAKCLLAAGQYREAADRFDALRILPCEGSTEARDLMRQSHLMLAVNQMTAGRFDQALAEVERARQWPESLGAGKPYAEDVDERLEDWLAGQCYRRLDRAEASREALDRILAFRPRGGGSDAGKVIRVWALRRRAARRRAGRCWTSGAKTLHPTQRPPGPPGPSPASLRRSKHLPATPNSEFSPPGWNGRNAASDSGVRTVPPIAGGQ